MNRFYVYAIHSQDSEATSCVYVDEHRINDFAKKEFDPSSMKYSGALVEADTAFEAHQVYQTFRGGEILWAEEPTATKMKRSIHDAKENLSKAKNKLAKGLVVNAQIQKIAFNILDLNKQFAVLADMIYENIETPIISKKEVYERLKQRYIEQLENLKFNGGENDGKGSRT